MERLRERRRKNSSYGEAEEEEINEAELEEEANRLLQLQVIQVFPCLPHIISSRQDEKEYRTILRPFLVSLIASKVFDPSLLSVAMSQEESNSSSSPEIRVLNEWIQHTSETSRAYNSLGDQLVTTLLKGQDQQVDERSELVSKTVGDLLSRVYMSELSQPSLPFTNKAVDLSDHYQR